MPGVVTGAGAYRKTGLTPRLPCWSRKCRNGAAAVLLWAVAQLPLSMAMAQRPPTPPAQSPAVASSRTEILTYDNWTVTCNDIRDGRDRRVCSGELNIFQETPGQARRVVFSWLIGLNKDGQLVMALRFPPGISVQPGVEIKLADRPARRVPITICEPSFCEASQLLDEPLLRDAVAATQTEAMVVASDGRQVTFTVYLKGFAQAVAAVRK
jgi:invasion protein IalB